MKYKIKVGNKYLVGESVNETLNGAFVFYHEGDTASKTPFDCMRKIENGFTIKNTTLGGVDND